MIVLKMNLMKEGLVGVLMGIKAKLKKPTRRSRTDLEDFIDRMKMDYKILSFSY
ncbi:MAG: hypothetical protein IPK03_17585 [Bacteroidetes bacterium]|nr:hypothetical protein [Bacteroidota bacterium]